MPCTYVSVSPLTPLQMWWLLSSSNMPRSFPHQPLCHPPPVSTASNRIVPALGIADLSQLLHLSFSVTSTWRHSLTPLSTELLPAFSSSASFSPFILLDKSCDYFIYCWLTCFFSTYPTRSIRNPQTFSINSQKVNISGFCHMASVATTPLCCCSVKAARDNTQLGGVSNETLLMETKIWVSYNLLWNILLLKRSKKQKAFLAYRLYRNRGQAGFGQCAVACWP